MKRKIFSCFSLLFVLGLLPACVVTTPITPSPPPTANATLNTFDASPAAQTATSIPQPIPKETSQAKLTIRGIAIDVSFSARVIFLEHPVQDISTIALTDKTQILLESGGEATLQAITPGTHIQAAGEMGSPGTLIATQLVLLGR